MDDMKPRVEHAIIHYTAVGVTSPDCPHTVIVNSEEEEKI